MRFTRHIVLCAGLVALTAANAFSTTPTSGARLDIVGTVGAVAVNRTIYDSQIHTGNLRTVPTTADDPGSNCTSGDQDFPTDAYVLQGGSWTGCDPGDAFETSQGTGTATVSGTGYKFDITTQYLQNYSGHEYCGIGVSPAYCANPDTGFLTITNSSGTDFTGTITLTATAVSPSGINPTYCITGLDTINLSGGGLANGASATFALSTDSSNCGGWNAAQTLHLTAGQTSIASFGKDDYQITPLNSASGETLTVLPVPVPAGPLSLDNWLPGNFGSESVLISLQRFSAGNFFATTYACIPYADFSAAQNPVCVELQLTPGGGTGNYLYTTQNDFNIDANSLPGGIGGPAFLGHHGALCPDSGFNINIFFTYTAPTVGDPIKGSGSGTGSCWVAAFDPNADPIPTGQTFSSFVGFQTPVSDSDLNIIKAGSAVPLIWQQFSSPGVGVTNLSLCPAGPTLANPAACATSGVVAPWVFLGTIVTSCITDTSPNTDTTTTVAAGGSGLQNFGDGTYQYNWKTVKGATGCVDVVLIYDSGLTLFPAQFKYK